MGNQTNMNLESENRRLAEEVAELKMRLADVQDRRIKELNARLEQLLAHKRFRFEAQSFTFAHPSVDELVAFIAEHLLTLFGCDRVTVGGSDGTCQTWTQGGGQSDDCRCFRKCPLSPAGSKRADETRIINIPDVRESKDWVFPAECSAKSIISILVKDGGRVWRRLSLHYVQTRHEFNEYELHTLESVANLVTTVLERQRLRAAQDAEAALRVRTVAAEQAVDFIARLLKHIVSFAPEIDPMDYVLSEIGSYAEADRCSLYYYRAPGQSGLIDNPYEWCAPGVPSAVSRRQGYDMAVLPDFHALISAGKDFFLWPGNAARPDTRAYLAGKGLQGLIAAPIQNEHGEIVGFVGFDYEHAPLADVPQMLIDSIHEAMNVISVCRTRRLAFEAVQAAERAKSDFFASVSHDIRTPLNSIIGFSELLKNETDPDIRREYLDSISFSGNTLLELVNDVLDLARLDAGSLVFEREPFDLKHQVRLILRTFESTACEKSLALCCEIGELPIFELDEHRIRQVLFNLVGNAVKYTDEGAVTVTASFERTSDRKGTLRIAVRDTGIGIAAEDIVKLMQPYVRLQGVSARGGTGLGLAICKRIVESMGGRISISSELGKGSVFAVCLSNVPYQSGGRGETDTSDAAGADVSAAAGTALPAVPSSGTVLPERDFSALRVLVVDDLEMNRRVLVASCRRLGARQTAEAASSVEALGLLRREKFDLVLTDMKMPGMDGGAFIHVIREDPKLRDLPVFLVTADIEALKYHKTLGADGVLLKPVVQARLAETLSGVCMRGEEERSSAAI